VSARLPAPLPVAGPYFEDLRRGCIERGAPAVTLTEGLAALHQAIVGDRLRLPLDVPLSRSVTGAERVLAHPALVWDVAIGQSTVLTQRVIANLFYRGLVLHRAPLIGDTLRTTTEVVALKQNHEATGLAVLRILTVDQDDRPVLDFTRCAMLPLQDPSATTGQADEIDGEPPILEVDALAAAIADWDLARMREPSPGVGFDDLADGTTWDVAGGDVVSAAPELARLSLNVAMAHLDRRACRAGQRLVYGGHTIGLAASQVTRALPNLAMIVAWHSCDHLAPVLEGDTLCSTIELERRDPLPSSGGLVHLRSRVRATRADESAAVEVLDWCLVAVLP
jgi:acyl dehydratase